jgi:N-acetylglucosamine transport system permease protein
MALPVFLGIVPLFMLMNDLGLLNTRAGLMAVYTAYMLSFPIFILYAFFKTLPNELAEAALIDGCSPFGVFWRVMLPLAKPGIVTAGIFVFIGLWNEFPLALVFLSDADLQTLPVGVASLTMTQRYQADWGALFAALTISVIPTVLFYMMFQKQIQAGLTSGALKR